MTLRNDNRLLHGDTISAVHVIAGLDEAHGGPSYSVPRLCESLAAAKVKTTLLSVAGVDVNASDAIRNGCNDRRFFWDYAHVALLRNLRKSSGLSRALRDIIITTTVVHNHGLWLMPNFVAGWEAQHACRALVMSPRGMLSPAALAYSRFKKRVVWSLVQGQVLRNAACIHATS
jgi:hypothetical protein